MSQKVRTHTLKDGKELTHPPILLLVGRVLRPPCGHLQSWDHNSPVVSPDKHDDGTCEDDLTLQVRRAASIVLHEIPTARGDHQRQSIE